MRISHFKTITLKNANLSTIHTDNRHTFLGLSNGTVLIHNDTEDFKLLSYEMISPVFDPLSSQTLSGAVCSITSYEKGNGNILLIAGGERSLCFREIPEHEIINGDEQKEVQNKNGPKTHLEDGKDILDEIFEKENPYRQKLQQKKVKVQNSEEKKSSQFLTNHSYEIHSLELSNHYLMSCDYFTIEMFNLNKIGSIDGLTYSNSNFSSKKNCLLINNLKSLNSYNLLNIKPKTTVDSVITTCKMINHDNIIYGTSSGQITGLDLRCNQQTLKWNFPCEYELFNTIYDICVAKEIGNSQSLENNFSDLINSDNISENHVVVRTVNKIYLIDSRKEGILWEKEVFEVNEKIINWMRESESFYEKMGVCVGKRKLNKISTFNPVSQPENIIDSPISSKIENQDFSTNIFQPTAIFTSDLSNNILLIQNDKTEKVKTASRVNILKMNGEYLWTGGTSLDVWKVW